MSIRWFAFITLIVFIFSCEKQPTIPTILVEKVYDGSTALECVYFTDANNGYAGGDDGIILVTHNGGESWTRATLSGGENARFTCISFPAHDTGWISGRENQSSMNTGPALYKTINGGVTWQSVSTSYDMEFTHFPSVMVGYRDSNTDDIEKSSNGGQNWNVLSAAPYAPFSYHSLYFVNEDTGFVGTENGEFRTINGGASWSTVNFPSYTLQFNGVTDYAFCDNSNGVAVFSRGDIDVTTDGGMTWSETFDAYSNDYYPLSCVTMPGPGFIAAGGMNYLVISTDGGQSWEQTFTQDGVSFPGEIRGLHFYDAYNGFAVTVEGDIYKLTRPQ